MPSKDFPVFVLQNGVKMTLQPPSGIRANLKTDLITIREQGDFFEGCSSRPNVFKKILFGIVFFHGVVRERCKFGPLGWNVRYAFSAADLKISLDQWKGFADDIQAYKILPWKAMNYLTGECNYGGRVTDDKDRRCILTILEDFFRQDVLNEGHVYSPSGTYHCPPDGSIDTFIEYSESLPMVEGPEIFGLHDNADITAKIGDTNMLLKTALSLQAQSASDDGMSWEDQLTSLATSVDEKVPQVYDVAKVEVLYPVMYSESMNTVLTQECIRFNKLIAVVKSTLSDVRKAVVGLVLMSEDLDKMGKQMVNGFVPDLWGAVAYPSLKPLGSWVTDLVERLDFLQKWIEHDKPPEFWLSGFFFTQSFVTGTRQNFARKYSIPIDELVYTNEVMTPEAGSNITEPAKDGAYVYGVFLQGCDWDTKATCAAGTPGALAPSRPKVLIVTMPRFWLKPTRNSDVKSEHSYTSPTYKTSERAGTLSTTGHSTNFVMYLTLPMQEKHCEADWIKSGVALLTTLDD